MACLKRMGEKNGDEEGRAGRGRGGEQDKIAQMRYVPLPFFSTDPSRPALIGHNPWDRPSTLEALNERERQVRGERGRMDGTRGRGGAGAGGWSPFEKTADEPVPQRYWPPSPFSSTKPTRAVSYSSSPSRRALLELIERSGRVKKSDGLTTDRAGVELVEGAGVGTPFWDLVAVRGRALSRGRRRRSWSWSCCRRHWLGHGGLEELVVVGAWGSRTLASCE